jgi:hypothetical protein
LSYCKTGIEYQRIFIFCKQATVRKSYFQT